MINPAAAVAVAATADVVALFCCPPKTIHYNCYTDETFSSSSSSSSSTLSLFPFLQLQMLMGIIAVVVVVVVVVVRTSYDQDVKVECASVRAFKCKLKKVLF